MLTPATTAGKVIPPFELRTPLTATDRCDRCGSQAYVRIVMDVEEGSGELLFCSHHGRKVVPGMKATAYVQDETYRLEASNSA
jgi:hypothetical protein